AEALPGSIVKTVLFLHLFFGQQALGVARAVSDEIVILDECCWVVHGCASAYCPPASIQLDVLILPPALEPGRCQFGISDCVLDVLVTEVCLQPARVVALVREFVAASVPQHVRVRLDLEPSSLASSANELLEVAHGHWRAALGHEQKRRSAFGVA